jgi:ubiquitin-conjugating enzyme (huntingtin interacting protein 2)
MYKNKPEEFVQTAKYWTETFAKKNQGEDDGKVSQLVEMGFSADAARKALMANAWDETLALNSLLGG